MTATEPGRDEIPLKDCPIGLFVSADGELCLKTEYGDNNGRIDAYIVSSGEFFWGNEPQTSANQRMQMVRPVVARLATPADQAVRESTIAIVNFEGECRKVLEAIEKYPAADDMGRTSQALNRQHYEGKIQGLQYCIRSLTTEPKRS